MLSKNTIDVAYGDGVKAFLPLHLQEVINPNQSPVWCDTSSPSFERACDQAEKGVLVLLKGDYQILLEDAFREFKGSVTQLRVMTQTPRRVALLCSSDLPLELEGAPRINGITHTSMIPLDWFKDFYLLSLAKFADLQLRSIYEKNGYQVLGLPKPLGIKFGVFVPDGDLIRTFLDVVDSLKGSGEDDFSGKAICDIFSGSGVFGFLGGYLGARNVQFVDIDNLANSCVADNILQLSPPFETSLCRANVFPENKIKVDTIVANPPWKDVYRLREFSNQFSDPGGQILKRFFTGIKDYLNPRGVVYLFYEKAGRHLIFERATDFQIEEYPVPTSGAARHLFRLQLKS